LVAAQVASHAQKYFIRLNSMNKKDKRRSSIHDITSPGGVTGDITGAPWARPFRLAHASCMLRVSMIATSAGCMLRVSLKATGLCAGGHAEW
jgi:hypothetical protein